jgi:hypothetical protein
MTDTPKDPANRSEAERSSAWAKVQQLLNAANDAVVAWQQKFATVGQRIADPPEIPDTPAHRAGQAKRQRHADAVAEGSMNYKDIALERQAEFAARFAQFPEADRATLNDWAMRQEARTGSPLGVVFHHAVPWPLVYLTGRYGEEVEHWPTALSDADRTRINALDSGGRAIKYTQALGVAVADKADKRRVHLFAHADHAEHLEAATTAHAARTAAAK